MVACILIEEESIHYYGKNKRLLKEQVEKMLKTGVREFMIPVRGTYTQIAIEVFNELSPDCRPFEIKLVYADNREGLELKEHYRYNRLLAFAEERTLDEKNDPYVRYEISRNRELMLKSDYVICFIDPSFHKEIWKDALEYCSITKKDICNLYQPLSAIGSFFDPEDKRTSYQKDNPFFKW